MTVEAIKDAIVNLPEPERQELADWLEELEDDAWDREMDRTLPLVAEARISSMK